MKDQDSSLFCAPNWNPRRETFRLAGALQKKGAKNYFLATRDCSLSVFGISAISCSTDGSQNANLGNSSDSIIFVGFGSCRGIDSTLASPNVYPAHC
jgi:hypothetical protein